MAKVTTHPTCTPTNLNIRTRSSTLYANAPILLASILLNFRRRPESHLQLQVSEKSGVQEFGSTGVLEYWSTGVPEYWSAGVLEYWSTGVLEYWSTGVLECWSAGVESGVAEISPQPSILGYRVLR